jgi:hypothetical protein
MDKTLITSYNLLEIEKAPIQPCLKDLLPCLNQGEEIKRIIRNREMRGGEVDLLVASFVALSICAERTFILCRTGLLPAC